MIKVVFAWVIAAGVWAAPYSVGQQVPPMELSDQFDQKHLLQTIPDIVVMVFEREASATVNGYLSQQEKGYLEKRNAAFVADISQMPRFVAESFALPKMREYPYAVLLIRDEEQGLLFPGEEGKITVMKFRGNILTQIQYVTTAAELKAAIEQ